MIEFAPTIRKDLRRTDGTFLVYIRLTYKRRRHYIATAMSAGKADLNAAFKIKNQHILQRCDQLIAEYRSRAMALAPELRDIPFRTLVAQITARENNATPSFTEWAHQWIAHADIKSKRLYHFALASFQTFMKEDIVPMEDITTANLNAFAASLIAKRRAQVMYPSLIARLFREARDRYNDEDAAIIRIHNSLRNFKPPRTNYDTEKRALSPEVIRRIFAEPYYNSPFSHVEISRHDLALDCFRLSFLLLGMNSADLYAADRIEDGHIVYFRQKTRDRRTDRAEMRVRIPELAKPLMQKYRDTQRVFNFHRRFCDYREFNRSLNNELRKIATQMGLPALTFYAARHSMATIAANECGIDKFTVSEMLCHTVPSMRITDIYIRRDFSHINDAMQRVIDFLFPPRETARRRARRTP